jgi:methyltransferase (TIGR00027 family)
MTITDPISLTARLTAAARARESRRPDRLFEDPYAAALAGPEGFAFMQRTEDAARVPGAPAAPDGNPYIAIRTRAFDDFFVDEFAAGAPLQVVMLAAGLDSRAYRLHWPDGTHLYELDRPAVLDAKQAILDGLGARARCHRQAVPVDLLADWTGPLTAAGFDPARRSLWLIEGLFPYLEQDAAAALLARAASRAAPGSRLATDIVSQSFLDSPWTRAYLQALERAGAPWKFGTDQPEDFLAAQGWSATATQPGDPTVSHGRWPYPVFPRDVPHLPKIFLVRATRG